MIKDIIKFVCIFLIFFSAFIFALNNLYWYYNQDVRKRFEIKIPYNQKSEISPFYTHAEIAFGT
jgi:hypothetical protein